MKKTKKKSMKKVSKDSKVSASKGKGKPSKKEVKKETIQFIFFAVVIAVLFLSFLVPYFYVKNQRIFEYNNLTWQVEKDGDVTFYHTQFGKYYRGEYRGVHNTFLRHDPRNNPTPLTIENFEFYRSVAITTDKELLECENQILVTDALAQMTQGISFVSNISFGITNEAFAAETNRDYISCDNIPIETTVIHVKSGVESHITQSHDGDCMVIQIGSCEENLITAEKFVVEVITELNRN